MAVTCVSKARIWPQKHRSGNVTWKVQVGKKNDGKPDIRSFETEAQATVFRDNWNVKLVTGNTNGLEDLSKLARAEVLAALANWKHLMPPCLKQSISSLDMPDRNAAALLPRMLSKCS
jgi:hypothetical protein